MGTRHSHQILTSPSFAVWETGGVGAESLNSQWEGLEQRVLVPSGRG
jgi:hypothetical protein